MRRLFRITFLLAVSLTVWAAPADASVTESNAPTAPVYSHPAGTFAYPFQLTIDSDPGTTVYYTLDGRYPSRFTDVYETGETIRITGTMVVRARAYDEQGGASEVTTSIYIQLDPSVREFESNLPLVVVNQFDDVMEPDGSERSTVYFSVIDPETDGRARLLTDDLHLHSRSRSNYRGSSSLWFPKKQFAVRLIDDEDIDQNESILGMPPDNNWIMYAPWDDRTLIRNAIAYQLSRDMGRYAPRTGCVELFLNEGSWTVTADHYHGVYMLTERIKWDDNRVNITRLWPDVSSEPDISGGYIINYDRDVHFRSTHSRNTGFALVRPQTEDITPQQRAWIAAYVGGLESALFGPDFDNPDRGYAAWLEPESFIDHHLITEALKEMDGFRLSTFMHKDRGRRLVMGPVWDFNLSMGNHNPAEGWGGDSPSGWYHRNLSEQQYLNGWYRRLFMDPDFEERYHTRWWELRHGPFATEHVVGMIRQYVTLLDEAQRRNFVRWPILGEDVWHYSRAGLPTYEAEIDALIDFLENRFRWIDSVIPSPKAPPGPQLQYFWLFDDRLPNDIPLETVDASYALTNRARLHFHSALAGYPFDEDDARWRKASMERRNRPTELNYRPTANMGRAYEPATMRALQVRQPFQGNGRENTIIFELPTTSLSDVVFRFAALTEGAASELVIDYSVIRNEDGVRLWTVDSLPGAHYVLHEDYDLYEVDFGDINLVNDNEDFAIRIRFDGDNMTADEGMRVTFSNFSLEAVTISERTAGRPNGPDDRPRSFELRQNYPNPFSSETTISYELPGIRAVRLDIFDLLGRRLATLVDEDGAPGLHEVTFDATNLASGPYLYRLSSDDGSITRMMTVTR